MLANVRKFETAWAQFWAQFQEWGLNKMKRIKNWYWRSWAFVFATAFFNTFVIEKPEPGWMPWLATFGIGLLLYLWAGLWMILYKADEKANEQR